MIKVNDFFTEDASDGWFSKSLGRTGPIHDKLKSAGYSIVDRERLGVDYKDMMAPFDTAEFPYSKNESVPSSNFRTVMMLGRAFDLKKTEKEGACMKDVLDEWMQLLRGDEKYIMSLFPKSYLFATSSSVSFDDIENIRNGAWFTLVLRHRTYLPNSISCEMFSKQRRGRDTSKRTGSLLPDSVRGWKSTTRRWWFRS